MGSADEAVRPWRESAPYWEKYRETIRVMFAPVTEALVAGASVGSGHTVLDIATGPGEPALTIASMVGEGQVWGIDPAPEMVEAARREATRLGLGNARFEVGFADQLPFANDTFDAVVSRFGAMFFPSPTDAVREILRVLKPTGKLALAVWGSVERNPFFYALDRVLERYIETPPPAPDAPNAFRFSRPGELLEVLNEAGVANASERVLSFQIEAPISAEDFWAVRSEMSEKLRARVAALGDRLPQVRQEAIEAFQEYAKGDGMSFASDVLIVSGSKRG
jgi:ubiquinone/menaquinone biosynthesis C-methylase UbiE